MSGSLARWRSQAAVGCRSKGRISLSVVGTAVRTSWHTSTFKGEAQSGLRYPFLAHGHGPLDQADACGNS